MDGLLNYELCIGVYVAQLGVSWVVISIMQGDMTAMQKSYPKWIMTEQQSHNNQPANEVDIKKKLPPCFGIRDVLILRNEVRQINVIATTTILLL